MRTAEEILRQFDTDIVINKANALKAIKQAMKEAIEASAEYAETKEVSSVDSNGESFGYDVVDKDSILSLINELT